MRPDPAKGEPTMMSMRAAVKLLLLSLLVFAVAFGIRRTFLWDVMPIAWDQGPQSLWALGAAFLLRSIENLAGVLAAIVLAFVLTNVLLRRHHSPPSTRGSG
jgi:hypothetical protein